MLTIRRADTIGGILSAPGAGGFTERADLGSVTPCTDGAPKAP